MKRSPTRAVIQTAVLITTAMCATAFADTITITVPEIASQQPINGRAVVFFIDKEEISWNRRRPIDGPFYSNPQPIASVEVSKHSPGETIKIDKDAVVYPDSIDTLDGIYLLQAVLDTNHTQSSHKAAGNWYCSPIEATFSTDSDDAIALTLAKQFETQPLRDIPNVTWVKYRSELLSEFYGRDIYHRAGVALPLGYREQEEHGEEGDRRWPTIYIVPGFGSSHTAIRTYASMLANPDTRDMAPQAVYVMLDPDSPLGHHGFVDSANNGPRATALVEEMIAHLESKFRLARKPQGRIITGHSSGGWSALWLQLHYPNVFGACWSSAPDPIDFTAFQMSDLYEDQSIYIDENGNPQPSYRTIAGPDKHIVQMTVRQECLMERAIDPTGKSGQQWDAWEAMFSPRDPETKLPQPMYDPLDGDINEDTIKHWRKFDIAALVTDDWKRFGPIVAVKVRLACGEHDSFYLNRAVSRFRKKVDQLKTKDVGQGYIRIVPHADHSNIVAYTTQRWNKQMRAFLRRHGLHE